MSLSIKCPDCSGFGYTKGGPAGPWEKLNCQRCNGTGSQLIDQPPPKPGLSIEVQRELVYELLHRHPMPWRIEIDWLIEVTDANNRIIAKFQNGAEAQELIDFATAMDKELRESAVEIENMLADEAQK